jgi:hypothetical protein
VAPEDARVDGRSPAPEAAVRKQAGYEPPRVERVYAPEDLEREVIYAGPGAGTPAPA